MPRPLCTTRPTSSGPSAALRPWSMRLAPGEHPSADATWRMFACVARWPTSQCTVIRKPSARARANTASNSSGGPVRLVRVQPEADDHVPVRHSLPVVLRGGRGGHVGQEAYGPSGSDLQESVWLIGCFNEDPSAPFPQPPPARLWLVGRGEVEVVAPRPEHRDAAVVGVEEGGGHFGARGRSPYAGRCALETTAPYARATSSRDASARGCFVALASRTRPQRPAAGPAALGGIGCDCVEGRVSMTAILTECFVSCAGCLPLCFLYESIAELFISSSAEPQSG